MKRTTDMPPSEVGISRRDFAFSAAVATAVATAMSTAQLAPASAQQTPAADSASSVS